MSDNTQPPGPLASFLGKSMLIGIDHAATVGRVVIAWSGLMESLGVIFAAIFGEPAAALSLAGWHSVKSDRAQREMLSAVAQIRYAPTDPIYVEIAWILSKLDSWEIRRNTAAHAPYGALIEGDEFRIIAAWRSGNPHAKKLKDRDLSLELKSYGENIGALAGFAGGLAKHLIDPEHDPLPERPPLPLPAQKSSQPKQNPRKPKR